MKKTTDDLKRELMNTPDIDFYIKENEAIYAQLYPANKRDAITFETVYEAQRIRVSFASGQKPPSERARDTIGRAYSPGLFYSHWIPGCNSGNELPTGNFDDPISRADFCRLAAQLYRKVIPYNENPFSGTNYSSVQLPTFTDTTSHDAQEMAYLGVVNGVGAGNSTPTAN